jgi:hypothetical protein
MHACHSEAKILHEKIHHKRYSDDEILRIPTTRRKTQLQTTFNHYNNEFGHAINMVLAYLMKLLIIVSSLCNCALHQGQLNSLFSHHVKWSASHHVFFYLHMNLYLRRVSFSPEHVCVRGKSPAFNALAVNFESQGA